MNEKIYLKESFDFSENLNGFEFVAFSISFDKEICILGIYHEPYNNAHNFKIIIQNENYCSEIITKGELQNFHFVEKLPNEEILLVNARANYYGNNDYEKNARIYNYQGELKKEFHLGDSIEDIQTTKAGELWVSYFDESVSWRIKELDSAGVVCWDLNGNKIYGYNDNFILNCYSMNVVSKNEVWFYYYTGFPIVRLKNKKEITSWECSIKGFHLFALWKNYILTSGGYKESNFHLLEISEEGKIEEKYLIEFFNEDEIYLNDKLSYERGDLICFYHDNKCYKFNLREFI
jgi:hypothetical protein